jgi:RNA polymerase sigma factor (sigma-70 family)
MTEVSRRTELEVLYREEAPRMWRAMLLFAGDREIASDAVAEAFAQALRRGDELRDPGRWVWKTAYRVAAGQLQQRGRIGEEPPERTYDLAETSALLSMAMRQLSPMQRASVVLHDYAGYKLREVALMTGSTTSAVGVHLSRARAKLRRLLEDAQDA